MVLTLAAALAGWGASTLEAQDGPVTLEYVAHASFLIHSPGGQSLLIDPYASRVWLGYDFPPDVVPPTVLITHPHYDHDGGRYREMDVPWQPTTRIIDGPGVFRVGDVTITGIPGKHADPYGKEFGQLNTIFLIEAGDIRMAHLGDNGPVTPENVAALGQVDVLFMPIDGEYHILSDESVERTIQVIEPAVVVPMHYRIPALETDPDSPSDLGPIDPWLEGRQGVLRLDSHRYPLGSNDLDGHPSILVFRHSPSIPTPSPESP